MTRSEAYNGIFDDDTIPNADAHRVFFVFIKKQLTEGMEKFGYKDTSEIVSTGLPGLGLYGAPECVKSFMDEYEAMEDRVRNECDPQKVYEYEFSNHECGYTGSDEEAIQIVVSYFGKEKARQVRRQNALVEV
jgi:hypothetical protein